MGLSVSQLCDYWAMTGISSSGIKGVEGIGAKGALALLQEFNRLDNLLSHPNTAEIDKIKLRIGHLKDYGFTLLQYNKA